MSFRLSCAQFRGEPGEVARNLDTMARLAKQAAEDDGADLVVFAEMAPTCYTRPEILADAAQPLDGEIVRFLCDVASSLSIDLAFGMPELSESDGARYNTMVYLGSDGRMLATYRKTHLFGRETDWARPGDSVSAFDTRLGLAAMWVCYDTRFPEVARASAVAGARFAVVSTAWLGPPDEWELAVRSRAMDNGIFRGGGGPDWRRGGLVCRGLSLIADPHGRVIARAEPGCEGICTAEIDLRRSRRFSRTRPGAQAPADRSHAVIASATASIFARASSIHFRAIAAASATGTAPFSSPSRDFHSISPFSRLRSLTIRRSGAPTRSASENCTPGRSSRSSKTTSRPRAWSSP